MTVLPPPLPPQSPAGEAATDTVASDAAPTGARHGLSVTYRWVLAVGWAVIMSTMGAIAQSAFLADTGPFWLGVKPLPFALPVLTLLALVGNWRTTLWVSLAAALATAGVAVGDLVGHHGAVAVTEFVCAAGALVLTAAGALSRPRRIAASEPTSS